MSGWIPVILWIVVYLPFAIIACRFKGRNSFGPSFFTAVIGAALATGVAAWAQ